MKPNVFLLYYFVSFLLRFGFGTNDAMYFNYGNFSCPEIKCDSILRRNNTFMHFVAGTNERLTIPLLVHRVCEGFQKCIPSDRYLVVLHVDKDRKKSMFKEASLFLNAVGVNYTVWYGKFTADAKMMQSIDVLKSVGSESVVYHTDLDEIPKLKIFLRALKELESGSCDFIRGHWLDRVSSTGELPPVQSYMPKHVSSSGLSMAQQFPLVCNISAHFMPERTTWKALVYRSNLRATSGQHDVWCNAESKENAKQKRQGRAGTWSHRPACMTHIRHRLDQISFGGLEIYDQLPILLSRPRACETTVPIFHYKFVAGVAGMLKQRAKDYKSFGFRWWGQSHKLAKYLAANEGRIDVNNPEFNCKNMSSFV